VTSSYLDRSGSVSDFQSVSFDPDWADAIFGRVISLIPERINVDRTPIEDALRYL
jgi:hypothetical protein